MFTQSQTGDPIVERVQRGAALASRDAAVTAVRAVLTTLGERIGLELGQELASRLPRQIGMFLAASDAIERFDARELVRRVAEREAVGWSDALHHARVVLSVIGASIPQPALAKVRGGLSPDYEPLFALDGARAKTEWQRDTQGAAPAHPIRARS